ncbi:MAG: hypothetical protein H7174_12275, partial [Flavobacterium sp.]|nr:hypothetical protein [Flavobacterium sp.]
MRKLIHSNFELDLSTFKISDTEENSWFSENFFTRYSFPFEIDLVIDLDVAFGFISFYNTNPATYFNCKYVYDNQIEDAIFEIESLQDKLSCTLRFGFDQLPSFDKKLSELSLAKFDLPSSVTIYDFANQIVNTTWPNVNFNFPQVHIDKIETKDDDVWQYFEKIINNRKNNSFISNSADYIENQTVTYNRNILQPLPYWLHILHRGMIDSGYILSGDIINDLFLQKATLYGDVDYYYKNEMEFLERVRVKRDSYYFKASNQIINDYYYCKHLHNQPLKGIGSYRIFYLYHGQFAPGENNYFKIYVNNIIVFSGTITDNDFDYPDTPIYGDFTFTTNEKINIIKFEFASAQLFGNDTDGAVFFYDINPMYYYDENNTPITTIINENKIDLTKAVPDITFGDFVKVIKNWFNYDLRVQGNLAIMDKIENQINYNNSIDLTFTEKKIPIRKFQQGMSFLLKFQAIDNKDFVFLPVFQNNFSTVNEKFITNEKTNTIEIAALPLPKV